MAMLVTVADMQTRAIQRANMENSGFVTPAEVTRLLSTHYGRMWNRLAKAVPRYFSTDYPITTVPNQVAYPLPPDFHSLQAVYALEQTQRHRPLRNLTDTQRQVFRPPQGAYQVILRYTPTPKILATDTDEIDGVSGLDELVVALTARDLMVKEEADVSAVNLEVQELLAEVMSFGTSRDIGQPEYVTEVEDYEDWPYPYAMAVNAYQVRAGNLDLYSVAPVWP